MNWIGYEAHSTIATVIGLILLAVIIVKGYRKRKTVVLALFLLMLLSSIPVGFANQDLQNETQDQQLQFSFQPQTYRYGDLAVVPIVFPYSMKTYEAVWVNETGNLTAIWQEKIIPTELYNPVFIQIVVFNATKDNPVYLFVDNKKYEFTSEGVFSLMFNLTETVHSFSLACKYKIFVTSLVFVKNFEREQYYVTIYEMLREKQRVIMTCIFTAVIGAWSGTQGKKITKVTNYYFLTFYLPFIVAGLYDLLNYYFLAVLGLSGCVAYIFAKEFKQTLLAVRLDHKHGRVDQALQLDIAIEERPYLLESGPRGLINALKNNWKPIEIISGEFIDIGDIKLLFFEDMKEEEDKITITGDWAFTEAFTKAGIVEEYAGELHDALTQLLKYESAFDVEVARKVYRILKGEENE